MAQQSVDTIARTLPEWNTTFRSANPQWRGADASYSIPLAEDRTLCLFGDTWIVKPDAPSRSGARMIRNSLGVQRVGAEETSPPEYHWSVDAGVAVEPLRPVTGPGWLWPLSGLRRDGHLVLFMSQLIASDKGLGFESAGNIVVVIDNPDAPSGSWNSRQYSVPFFNHTAHGDLVFGLANVALPDSNEIVVYGVREDWRRGFGGRELIAAKTERGALVGGNFSPWRFYDGHDWTENIDSAEGLFDEAASEMSVHYDTSRNRYIAVYTHFGMSDEILLRHATSPIGPWSAPAIVYRCPDVKRSEYYFCYAAKAHPELTHDASKMIVTYATNSSEFSDHVNDPELYWPQFIEVDLSRIEGLPLLSPQTRQTDPQ